MVTRKKICFLLLFFLIFFVKPVYSHAPEYLARQLVGVFLILISPIWIGISYVLKTKIFEYGFGKKSSIPGKRSIYIGPAALEAVFTLFFYITYFKIEPNTPIVVLTKTIILMAGYFLFAVTLNYVLIERKIYQAGDIQSSNRVFKLSIYLSLIYPLVFVILSAILILVIALESFTR